MLLAAGPLLLLQVPEVELLHLVSAQVDALVGEEVPGRPEDLGRMVLGEDVHQGAVYVEGDSPDVHQVAARRERFKRPAARSWPARSVEHCNPRTRSRCGRSAAGSFPCSTAPAR